MQAVVYNNPITVCPRTTLYSQAKLTLKKITKSRKAWAFFYCTRKQENAKTNSVIAAKIC